MINENLMWKILSLSIQQKNEKGCLEETLRVWLNKHLIKEIVGATHGLNWTSQQEARARNGNTSGPEMGIYISWILHDVTIELFGCECVLVFK